jgi:hypothetical protein
LTLWGHDIPSLGKLIEPLLFVYLYVIVDPINVLVLRMYKTDPVANVPLDNIPPPLYFEARKEPNGKL